MSLIAVITPLFPIAEEPYRGRAIYNTVVALQRHADVEVYCPLRVYPAFLEPRRYRYHRSDMSYRPAGVERMRYLECPAIPVLSRPFNGLLSARRLYPYLERSRPDLILNYWVYPEGYAAVRLGRQLAKPVIVSSRGSDLLRIGDGVTRRLVQTTVKAAGRVLTVSRQLRDRAVELGADPRRTRVIPNGCDREIFDYRDREEPRRALGLGADEKAIVFAGWLDPSKGMRELLEAFRVVAADPKTTLVCIGEGKMAEAIRAFAGQHQLQQRIRLEGKRSAPEVAQWMNAGDVFCLPSHSEGCPNVVVEAVSCGCPVVATDVGGIPDLISGERGILVPARDAVKLAEALKAALARNWDRREISRQSQRGWEQVAAETFAVCEELLRP